MELYDSNNKENPGNCCCIVPCYCMRWNLTSEPNSFSECFISPCCCIHGSYMFYGKVINHKNECYPWGCCCGNYSDEYKILHRRSDGLIYISSGYTDEGSKTYKTFAIMFGNWTMKYADYATRDMYITNGD